MNQEAHWNSIATSYDDEVFDVFKSDKNKILQQYFKKHANKRHEVIDFGCGIGKAFPFLSPAFKKVYATDISEACITIAKQQDYDNITFKRADLTKPNVKFTPAHFGLCCNVAILPDLDKNRAILRTLYRGLRKNGAALIVVPSFESMFFSSWRLVDWYKKEGVAPHEVPSHELNYFEGSTTDIIQGVINISGVPTKHYMASELQVLFDEAGLAITAIEKLEYDWSTEFTSPPTWLKAPYPWDWMVECKKLK